MQYILFEEEYKKLKNPLVSIEEHHKVCLELNRIRALFILEVQKECQCPAIGIQTYCDDCRLNDFNLIICDLQKHYSK